MRTLYSKIILVVLFILLGTTFIHAQVKIGNNPQNINLSSLLELESTNKAFVLSRVNTVQMNAIIPLEGAMVYNTDAQCMHYYDGIKWINICEAFANNLTFTSDAIANPDSFETITITPQGNNYNFEVSQINGSNIQDGVVDTKHITAGAITQTKIRDGAVNSLKIADKSIQTIDIAPGMPNRVLQTNTAGDTVLWALLDASTITGRDLTQGDNSIVITNGVGATLINTDVRVRDGGISTIKLDADAVDNTKLADNAVQTENIVDANVTDAKLDKTNISLTGFAVPTADLSIGTFKLTDVVDPTLDQDAATKKYVDDQITTSNVLVDANIFIGDATNIAQPLLVSGDATLANTGTLTIADDAITTIKILDGNVTNAKLDKTNISLTGFAVPTADLSIGTFKLTDVVDPTLDQDAATKIYVDNAVSGSNNLADSNIFIGDGTNIAQPLLVSGDATLDNTGALTIADDAITTLKILDANVTDGKLDKANISLTGFAVPTTDLSIGTFKLTNVVDPTAAQDAATKNYVDGAVGTINTLTNGLIYIGNAGNSATQVAISGDATLLNDGTLTIADDAITTVKILDANITEGKLDKSNISLTGFAIPTADLSIGTFKLTDVVDPTLDQDAATKIYVDNAVSGSNILADSNIFIGDGTNTAQPLLLNGDATLANNGILTIANNAVTPLKIDASLAGSGLSRDATGVLSVNPSAIPSKENSANKSLDVTLADGTNTKFPTELAVKTYVDNATVGIATNASAIASNDTDITALQNDKENTVNKSTDGTLIDNSDVDFPTEQAVKTYVDTQITASNTLTNGRIFIGNGTGIAQAQPLTGDVTITNTGVSSIGANKVLTGMIADGTILEGDLANNAVTNQKVLNSTLTISKLANVPLNPGSFLATGPTGTPTWVAATTLYDDASINFNGLQQLQVKDNGITSAKILDGTIVNADVSGTAAIVGSKILPTFTANVSTTGTLAVTGQTTINLGALSTTLPTNRGTANQVLTTDGAGAATWANSRNLATADLVQTAVRTYNTSGFNLEFSASNSNIVFTGTNSNIGIGNAANPPQNKLHVAGAIQSQGILNSDGTVGEPSYRFTNDTDTGMWRGSLVNYVRFSTDGVEAVTINPNQNVGIGTPNPTSKLQTAGSFATAILSTTTSLTLSAIHHTIIINGNNHNITLPAAGGATGRIYIIKKPTIFTSTISSYINSVGTTITTGSNLPNGVTQLQSDGTSWQQIN